MLNFQRTNENGSIHFLGESPFLFEFRYNNRFYGKCTFQACVRLETNRGRVICRDSIQILSQEVKRGTEENLLSSAHLFFTRVVQDYSRQRLCEESQIEEEQDFSWGIRLRSGFQKWRDQFLSSVHSLNLSGPLEAKNKRNID